GAVGIADRAVIGDGATISARSVVFGPSRIEAGSVVGGYPARPHREFLRAQAALYRLAPLVNRLEAVAGGVPPGASSDACVRRRAGWSRTPHRRSSYNPVLSGTGREGHRLPSD